MLNVVTVIGDVLWFLHFFRVYLFTDAVVHFLTAIARLHAVVTLHCICQRGSGGLSFCDSVDQGAIDASHAWAISQRQS